MLKTTLLLLCLGLFAAAQAQHQTEKLHNDWDKLLRAHVNTDGMAHYEGFQADKAQVDAYLLHLQKMPPQANWTKEDKLAYWINLYNAFTIQIVCENYPLKSLMDIDNGKVWSTRTINIASKDYTLDMISKDVLIGELKEPRIHFAINCSAQSCAPLLNAAWEPANMEQQLEDRTKTFVNNSKYNKITMLTADVSQIFEWYAADFGDIKAFISKYSLTKLPAVGKMKYKKYDWSLNKQTPNPAPKK